MTSSDSPPKSRAQEDCDTDTPHARKAEREHGKPDQLNLDDRKAEDRQQALVDEGIEETFPASDPVSVKRIT
ncbi:hypothetical protein [uncultured Brevundimonas sp.]|uniref:hypothetical protein n=1 Tax=uncultured Brevundimonas sp. TaxID=213418 RepID=UPI0025F5A79E|nr:hypothetical protein [uncultured Brevundimonas sp.]